MDHSSEKAITKMLKQAREDFELIDFSDIAEPFKFFHKALRSKYFMRMQKKFDAQFKASFNKSQGFEVIMSIEDHWQFYQTYYAERKAFNFFIDGKLFKKMKKRLSPSSKNLLIKSAGAFPKQGKALLNSQDELNMMLQEFKLLVQVIADFYDRGFLYNLLDPENERTFFKFGVKCTTINDIIIPFFLSRLFGSLNKVSAKFINKIIVILISKAVKVNISAWSLLLPELDFVFSGNNFICRSIESLIFSRLFDKQRGQLIFMFAKLNSMLSQHIVDLENMTNAFFASPNALDFSGFQATYEVLNAKYDEINGIKFPRQEGAVLNLKDICKITDFNIKAEIEQLKSEQQEVAIEGFEKTGFASEDVNDEEYWLKLIGEQKNMEIGNFSLQEEYFHSSDKKESDYDVYLTDFLSTKNRPTDIKTEEEENEKQLSQSITEYKFPKEKQNSSKNQFLSRFTIID